MSHQDSVTLSMSLYTFAMLFPKIDFSKEFFASALSRMSLLMLWATAHTAAKQLVRHQCNIEQLGR